MVIGHPVPLSKLLTYCVLRTTQPPTLIGTQLTGYEVKAKILANFRSTIWADSLMSCMFHWSLCVQTTKTFAKCIIFTFNYGLKLLRPRDVDKARTLKAKAKAIGPRPRPSHNACIGKRQKIKFRMDLTCTILSAPLTLRH